MFALTLSQGKVCMYITNQIFCNFTVYYVFHVCVCVCARARARACVCARVRVRARVCVCVCVCGLFTSFVSFLALHKMSHYITGCGMKVTTYSHLPSRLKFVELWPSLLHTFYSSHCCTVMWQFVIM